MAAMITNVTCKQNYLAGKNNTLSYASRFTNSFLFKDFTYLFIFRERGRKGGRGREKHQCVVALCAPRSGNLAHNPGMSLTGNLTRDPLVRRLVSMHWTTPAWAASRFNMKLFQKAFVPPFPLPHHTTLPKKGKTKKDFACVASQNWVTGTSLTSCWQGLT